MPALEGLIWKAKYNASDKEGNQALLPPKFATDCILAGTILIAIVAISSSKPIDKRQFTGV